MSICSFAAYKVPCQAASRLMPMALFEEDDSLDFTYEEMQSSESGRLHTQGTLELEQGH